MAEKKQKTKEITIDAKGRVLGRLASEIALMLQGKHKSSYQPNKDEDFIIKVQNAEKIEVTGKKRTNKIYWRYSGYPGGIYGRSFERVFKEDPAKVIRYAVSGMLPKNRMQKQRMKRLKIEK